MNKCALLYTLIDRPDLAEHAYSIEITRQHYDYAGRLQTDSQEIGQVYEIDNPNPLVSLEMPIGVNALVTIIELIQHEKNKNIPA